MKRINILGKDPKKIENMKEILESNGFNYVEENPDLVITYGGDGMFLIAERIFPGIPKICMKDNTVGNRCYSFSLGDILRKYSKKEFDIENIKKLKATHRGRFEFRDLLGTNDIVIRNLLPTEAVRFNVFVGNENLGEFIGDGIVVSTPYGSEGYFSSITGKSFKKGIGLAFNNVTDFKEPLFLSEKDKIILEIIRGPAILVSDNNRDYINLEKGDRVTIESVKDIARRVVLK